MKRYSGDYYEVIMHNRDFYTIADIHESVARSDLSSLYQKTIDSFHIMDGWMRVRELVSVQVID